MDKLKNCELFLFDMDGTLYLGDDVYEGARELMFDFPRMGKQYIYLTNNSSRAGEDYITRLRRLGFPCERENVFTSGMATGMYLNQRHPGATPSSSMKSSSAPATSCAAARPLSPRIPTGSARCPRTRSCPTAAASAPF